MCGIAGFVVTEAGSGSRNVLTRMTGSIAHRGPDACGYYDDQHAFLGHRRLSIIDLSGGAQPMANEDGTRWIIYNGEVFNHAGLREPLELAGHRYTSHCDTETILHSWEQYGEHCVDHFRGMFAFAIWDAAAKTLFCARDRLGIKPFYYFWDGKLFAFASEIKALLMHPAISARLDERQIPEYLSFGYISSEATLFGGIQKLMPGHWLRLKVGEGTAQLEIQPYWDPPCPEGFESRSDRDWIDECRSRVEETVRMRLMSDVPLGMFLSGGVDSSAIAALVKRMVPGPVETFSVGYKEREYSELHFSRQVAEALGTKHFEVELGREDFFNSLPNLVWHEDQPITWPSSVSLYYVARLAAERVKVVLTGEGCDELFAGYGRYRLYAWNERLAGPYRLLPGFVRGFIRGQIATSRLISATVRRKLQHTFAGREDGLESLFLDNFYSAFPQEAPAYANYLRYWNRHPRAPLLPRMLYSDQKTYLVELLKKQDRMSMACSIESRVPLLDHTLVEFASRVPPSLKLRGKEGKYIFKKAVEDLLPHDIVYRKKMGFPTPLRQWLREPGSEPVYKLLTSGGLVGDVIDRGELLSLLERQRSGQEDATDRVWRLLNLQIWGEIYLNGNEGLRANGILNAPLLTAR